MPWTNTTTNEISDSRPLRVRLSDSTTRTNEEVTDQLLEQTGWTWSEPVPEITEEITTSSTTSTTVLI